METEIEREDGRFSINTAHGAAELLYRIEGKSMVIYRTYTPQKERGKGLATLLAKSAYKFAERNGFEVIEACEFIKDYAKRQGLK